MPNALIIFVRNPERGKVKTRIAATAGADAALQVYRLLLDHTHRCTAGLSCDKYVFYHEQINDHDLWSSGNFYKELQPDGDLGQKMEAAFAYLFAKGYQRVCIIGSDCPELSPNVVEHAFVALGHHDLVIGPAKDGGYYLLGMRNRVQPVFSGISWSSSQVLAQTVQQASSNGLSTFFLSMFGDVDTYEDVPQKWRACL